MSTIFPALEVDALCNRIISDLTFLFPVEFHNRGIGIRYSYCHYRYWFFILHFLYFKPWIFGWHWLSYQHLKLLKKRDIQETRDKVTRIRIHYNTRSNAVNLHWMKHEYICNNYEIRQYIWRCITLSVTAKFELMNSSSLWHLDEPPV